MTQEDAPSHQQDNDTAPTSSNKSTTLSALWHGLGLFGESYLLFSVGTLRPIWETLYPSCFDEYDNSTCKHAYLSYKSITYSVVLGVMIGMVVLGVLANTIGRRRGSIITATFMALGSIMLTLSSIFLSSMPSILFPVMSISLFIFGFGVGGEYPLSASSASERSMIAMKERQKSESDKMKRLLQMSNVGGSNNESLNGNNNNNNQDRNDPCPTPRDIRMPSWQTLGSSSKTPKTNNIHNHNSLSIKTEQLTPVTESYYSGGQGDIPLSPTKITKETNNSLSSYNIGLRTRGREVLLVFSMQGLGIFANSLILTFLLLITKNKNGQYQQDGDDANDYYNDASYYYDQTTLLNIWRVTYAIGAAILTYVLVTRTSHLTESEVWIRDKEQREEERLERCQRESGVGFRPPQQQEMMGQDEKQTRKDNKKNGDRKNEKEQQEAVISPTMSSITMRSEFDVSMYMCILLNYS